MTLRPRLATERPRGWGLEPGAYILFLGRFSPEKNCDLLIHAYEQIDTPVKLVLAGGSSHSDIYVKLLRQHQSDRVRLLDWVSGEALDELLTNAMLFVLPSDMEGLSLAFLDAMGAGVGVLAGDIPENRELVEGAGFTFRRWDREDLERMLRLLISEPEVRKAAANKARERVWERYLWGRVAREIESVYMDWRARSLNRNRPPHREPASVTAQRKCGAGSLAREVLIYPAKWQAFSFRNDRSKLRTTCSAGFSRARAPAPHKAVVYNQSGRSTCGSFTWKRRFWSREERGLSVPTSSCNGLMRKRRPWLISIS